MLANKCQHLLQAFNCQLCFDRSRLVIKTGMEHAAVMAGLMPAEGRFFLEQKHLRAGPLPLHLVSGGEPHDAAADDEYVVSHLTRGTATAVCPTPPASSVAPDPAAYPCT